MIEKTVIDYLMGKTTADKEVYAEIPADAQGKYIVIEKTGSMTENRIATSTIAVKSHAPTMFDAMSLNEEVKAVMDQLPELDEIASCELNSDYNFTDSTSKQYRYQAVFQITHY